MSYKKKIQKGKIRKKIKSIWTSNVLTRKVVLSFNHVGNNIRINIQKKLEQMLYNKCSREGYVKNKSIKILSYSSGLVETNNVCFDVMFECEICHPVEGQVIKCKAVNITRAGIRALYMKEEKSPITIFIARDHHYNNEHFNKILENDIILIKVIGIRYELNDENISVLGELKPQKSTEKTKVTIID
jgi:hypothetical protein